MMNPQMGALQRLLAMKIASQRQPTGMGTLQGILAGKPQFGMPGGMPGPMQKYPTFGNDALRSTPTMGQPKQAWGGYMQPNPATPMMKFYK